MPLRNVQDLATVTTVDIAATIKTLLDGRTHRVLVDATGIHESRVSRLLGGVAEIRVAEIRLIEEAFGLGPGELIARAVGAKEAPIRLIETAPTRRAARKKAGR